MRMLSSIAVALALVCACGTDTNNSSPDGTNGDPYGGSTGGSDGGSHGGSNGSGMVHGCPPNAAAFVTVLGPSNPSQLLSLAAEPNFNALVGASNPSPAPGITGVRELSPAGVILQTLPFGSLVASDAAGNKYIAGVFSAPIDLGGGLELKPTGINDVFVIKLDPNNHVIFAKALGLCASSLSSLAVARDSRIALSGSDIGTVVLSPAGHILQQFPEAGQVAFDSTGDLLIAGSQTPTAFAFLERRDPSGKLVFRTSFEGQGVRITGIAIDELDNIVFVGDTTAFVDIFGVDITAQFSPESGRVTGAFIAKVTPSFMRIYVTDLHIVEANAVAVGTGGFAFVGGAITVNTGFFRQEILLEVAPNGIAFQLPIDPNSAGGRILALAVDSCSLIVGYIRQQSPNPASPIEAVVARPFL